MAPSGRSGSANPALTFRDPDGMQLALIGLSGIEAEAAWDNGAIPAEHAIRGFHGVTLMLQDSAPTAAVLTDIFGFTAAQLEGGTTRYQVAGAAFGGIVDLRSVGGFLPARMGRGSVHHLAFRAADDAAQSAMVAKLAQTTPSTPPSRRIATISAPSISASRAASCLKSRRTSRASPSMRTRRRSARR